MTEPATRRFAYFITPHGYGHAARAAAVMNSIHERIPDVVFDIFTRVPAWFFDMSLRAAYRYHETLTDIGLVQSTSMNVNLPETIRALDALLPYRPELIKELAGQVRAAGAKSDAGTRRRGDAGTERAAGHPPGLLDAVGCEAVICDIAPLGIAVAREAGLPAVLIENFTWDWIYAGYLDAEPRFAPFIDYLHEVFANANYHIQTVPVCVPDLFADLVSGVVSRKPRSKAAATRERLGVPQDIPLVMITMGGILTQYPFLSRLESARDVRFLIPGGSERYEQRGSLVLIPHHSDIYHPDMVEACSAVIGKLGYSTLAETYAAGLPFAYIPREGFRESPPMGRFAREVMAAVKLPEERFFSGEWLDLLPGLLSRPRRRPTAPNGADDIADFLLRKI